MVVEKREMKEEQVSEQGSEKSQRDHHTLTQIQTASYNIITFLIVIEEREERNIV